MLLFDCGDVLPGCPCTFRAEAAADLLREVGGHARAEHFRGDVPAELLGRVLLAVRGA